MRAPRLRSGGPLAYAWLLATTLALLTPGSAAAEAPRFEDDTETRSTNGAILLRWDTELGVNEREYELQEAADRSFATAETRYRGSFPSYFVSGRRDGTTYFRVRSRSFAEQTPTAWTEWSATKVVVVEHHDLRLALGLFIGGAAVFLATGLTLVAGARAPRSEPRS
ncbi:MAG: hypothetical protein R6X02_10945 [Enhygromyxa sp.]